MTTTTLQLTQPCIIHFKREIEFIFMIILFPIASGAQTGSVKTDEIKIESDSVLKIVTIDFNTPNMIDNLLVRIEDSEGHTIFLENKYNFSGNYTKSIDMKFQEKGVYTIKITEGGKLISRKIEIR